MCAGGVYDPERGCCEDCVNKLTPPQAAEYSGSQDQIRTPQAAENSTQNRLKKLNDATSNPFSLKEVLAKRILFIAIFAYIFPIKALFQRGLA